MKKVNSKILLWYKKSPLIIHPLFLVVGIYLVIVGKIIVFICYTLSALIHELGHFLVARKRGYKLLQVRLMPYGAELCGNLDEFIYSDEVIIALAGPITSIILSGIIMALWWLNPNIYAYTYELCVSSLVCGLFNFLPIYPLDGGRILVAVLCGRVDRARAIQYAKRSTCCFSVGLFMLFLISIFYTFNISFGILSIMLMVSSFTKSEECSYFRIGKIKYKLKQNDNSFEIVNMVVNKDMLIYKVYRKLKSQKFYKFSVVDDNLNELFCVDERIFENLSADDYKKTFFDLKKYACQTNY